MELSLRTENARVVEIGFEGRGCIISQAAASMLWEEIKGKSLGEVRDITEKYILETIGIQLVNAPYLCIACISVPPGRA